MKPIKLLSLFSGIGAFEKALDRLANPYDLEGYCEIDKYATKAYSYIHDTEDWLNYGDITKIDERVLPKDIDLITYGFPCQDISLAGKQKGFRDENGNVTRSGLFYDALRTIDASKPKIAIAENVKNLVSKKFTAEFAEVLRELDEAGYNNYWKVLNAKDYGIAQNRDRVFIVSIRKDIDLGLFMWPEKIELTTRLLDYLEDEVEESYFLSDKLIEKIMASNFVQEKNRIHNPNDIVGTLLARDYKDPKCVDLTEYSDKSIEKIKKNIVDVEGVANTITANPQRATIDSGTLIQVGQIYGTEKEPNPQAGRVYDPEGISPTLDSMQGGNRMPKILIQEKTKKGYAEAEEGDGVYINRPHQKRGVVQKGLIQTIKANPSDIGVVVIGQDSTKNSQSGKVYDPEGLAPTLIAGTHGYAMGYIGVDNKKITSNDLMIDENGNVKRYINSDIVDEFNPGDSADLSFPNGYNKANRVYKGYAPALTVTTTKNIVAKLPSLRIRKLTPLECFRLMGFDDEDFYKAAYGDNYDTVMKIMEANWSFENKLHHIKKIPQINSNSQLYKMAGNSIVVNVLEAILKNVIDAVL